MGWQANKYLGPCFHTLSFFFAKKTIITRCMEKSYKENFFACHFLLLYNNVSSPERNFIMEEFLPENRWPRERQNKPMAGFLLHQKKRRRKPAIGTPSLFSPISLQGHIVGAEGNKPITNKKFIWESRRFFFRVQLSKTQTKA